MALLKTFIIVSAEILNSVVDAIRGLDDGSVAVGIASGVEASISGAAPDGVLYKSQLKLCEQGLKAARPLGGWDGKHELT